MAQSRRLVPPCTRAWGIGLAATTAVISGFAVFVNGYGVTSWKAAGASTATYTTAKNLLAATALVALTTLVTRNRPAEAERRPIAARQWAGLVAIGLVGGSVPFLLFFEGLSRAASGQAAFIHKTLVVWVILLAVPLLKERLSLVHLGAVGLLIAGQYLLIGGIGEITLGTGELMILAATLLWAGEVVLAKRLLAGVSSLAVGTARMSFGVLFLAGYGLIGGTFSGLGSLGAAQWGWALATGAILTAYVATWFAALARAPAVDVTAILVGGAVITALLRAGIAGQSVPSPAGAGLVGLGVALVALWAWKRPARTALAPVEVEVRS